MKRDLKAARLIVTFRRTTRKSPSGTTKHDTQKQKSRRPESVISSSSRPHYFSALSSMTFPSSTALRDPERWFQPFGNPIVLLRPPSIEKFRAVVGH
jgi:hypothetical protein